MKDFVSQMLLPALFGGALSTSTLTSNSPVNLAILTINYSDFTVVGFKTV